MASQALLFSPLPMWPPLLCSCAWPELLLLKVAACKVLLLVVMCIWQECCAGLQQALLLLFFGDLQAMFQNHVSVVHKCCWRCQVT